MHDLRTTEDDLRASIPAHVRRSLIAEARRSVDGCETGGILLGFEQEARSSFWVTQAGDPGSNAIRRPMRFVRDLEHSERLAEAAYTLDGSQWIGDWHTHPGGPPMLSSIDLDSYRSVLRNSDMERFLAILALPNDKSWSNPGLHCWQVTLDKVEPLVLVDPLDAATH